MCDAHLAKTKTEKSWNYFRCLFSDTQCGIFQKIREINTLKFILLLFKLVFFFLFFFFFFGNKLQFFCYPSNTFLFQNGFTTFLLLQAVISRFFLFTSFQRPLCCKVILRIFFWYSISFFANNLTIFLFLFEYLFEYVPMYLFFPFSHLDFFFVK